jgi:thiosulfate dehydrogenase
MWRKMILGLIILGAGMLFVFSLFRDSQNKGVLKTIKPIAKPSEPLAWSAPDSTLIPKNEEGALIHYGKSLVASTAEYFGPSGKIGHTTNGMNCQNCHLIAGTKAWGNNYGGVFSTYPKFRERRGAIENIYQRINDCFVRSLNGRGLDSSSREMQAMLAYISWLGKDVPKGKKPLGSGIASIPFLSRAADPNLGKVVYKDKCLRCHGNQGEGKFNPDSISYNYPPLWGRFSYNTGAGLFRLSRFAGYVRDNMPFGAFHGQTQLSDEEAWDVAAFVNSQPRPVKIFKQDWPDISLKPVDHPFGPYTDGFSEQQHKYGPFGPIQKAKENTTRKKNS